MTEVTIETNFIYVSFFFIHSFIYYFKQANNAKNKVIVSICLSTSFVNQSPPINKSYQRCAYTRQPSLIIHSFFFFYFLFQCKWIYTYSFLCALSLFKFGTVLPKSSKLKHEANKDRNENIICLNAFYLFMNTKYKMKFLFC